MPKSTFRTEGICRSARSAMFSFLLFFVMPSVNAQVFYGPNGLGGLFKWDVSTNELTKLVEIPNMSGDLIKRSTGKNYGLVNAGGDNGSGYIFYLSPEGIPAPVFQFPAGKAPRGSLFEGNDTKLYGIIENGVFRYDPETNGFSMVFETISEGILGTKLMQASDGNFYGTESISNPARLYKILPSDGTVGTYSVLYNFTSELDIEEVYDEAADSVIVIITDLRASQPIDQYLLEITPGKLYGTTRQGSGYFGELGWPMGSIWSFNLSDNVFELVHRHMGGFGYVSFGLTQASDGRVYSMTEDISFGSMYSIDPLNPGEEAIVRRMENGGSYPTNGLVTEGSDGRLYAITSEGLDEGWLGTVVAYNKTIHEFVQIQHFDGTNGLNPSGRMVEAEAATLPVTLLNFTGNARNKDVQLNWNTNNENNFSRFEIERSSNSAHFSSIGTISGGGPSYQFTDPDPAAVNYYRLKMIDIDNQYQYSSIIQVNLNNHGKTLSVYPSPATSHLQVQLHGYNEPLTLEITDMVGRKKKQWRLVAEGSVTTSIDVNALKPGIYQLTVRGKRLFKSIQFFKQ